MNGFMDEGMAWGFTIDAVVGERDASLERGMVVQDMGNGCSGEADRA
jgi:hypothetical protein